MQKTDVNTALTIFLVATAVVMIGGSAMMTTTTTQTAEAKVNQEVDPEDGSVTRSGGEGGRTVAEGGDTISGGGGGHGECTADNSFCTVQDGRGGRICTTDEGETEQECGVGGGGLRATGDFRGSGGSGEPLDIVGGEGAHLQGPGGDSADAPGHSQ